MRPHTLGWIVLSLAAPALAQTVALEHAGYVLTASDTPLDGAVPMRFRLFDVSSGGTATWLGEAAGGAACTIAVNHGYYAVLLGGVGGCGTALAAADLAPPRYLEVELEGVALTPRIRLSPAPIAATSLDTQALAARLALATGTVNATGNPVDWSQLKNVPPSVADGDQDTTYSAGAGLALLNGVFSINTGAIANGMLANASVGVNPGTGLTGGGLVALGASTTLGLGNSGVVAGTYTNATVTVDATGRVLSAANGTSGGGSGSSGGTGLTWQDAATNVNASAGNAYVADAATGFVDVNLPASCAVGDRVFVVGRRSTSGFRVRPAAGQTILNGDATITGTAFLEAGRGAGATADLVCVTTDTTWTVVNGAALCTPGQQVFLPTGADQSFTVPNGCGRLTVKLWGAGGGGYCYSGCQTGGAGGFTSGELAVTAKEVLTIVVGGPGLGGQNSVAKAGGYGGGGNNPQYGASGGGRSAIRRGSTELATAGGGGGAGAANGGTASGSSGGAGGGLTGQDGGNATAGLGGGQGAGGGGTGGTGTQFQGAVPTGTDGGGGGSGGGGWYGGGAGGNNNVGEGGGGGGSGYVGGLIAGATTTGGNRQATAGTGDAYYAAPAGVGGAAASAGAGDGNGGRVVLIWGR